jgi:periplasmic protein TonB
MKHLLLILTCLAGINYTHGQVVIEFSKDNNRSRVFAKVEVKGAFPGGDTSWRSYLEKNINASMVIGKRAKKGKYTVVVNYIVTKDGTIADVKCMNDPGYGMCQESIRIIKKGVKWGPAKGRNVNAYRQ